MVVSEVCIHCVTDRKGVDPKSNVFVKSQVITHYEVKELDALEQAYVDIADESVAVAEQFLPCIIETWANIEKEQRECNEGKSTP